MTRKIILFCILACLLIAMAVPALATEQLPETSCADEAIGNHEVKTLSGGAAVTYSYSIPKDGAALVICYGAEDSASGLFFTSLNRFNWVKSGFLEVIAVETYGATQAETQTFLNTYAPDIQSHITAYWGNENLHWDYCIAAGSYYMSSPMVAVVAEVDGVPTILACDIRVTDADLVYHSLCQVSPAFAAANPPEMGETAGTWGDLNWKYEDSTGTLILSGKGGMPEESFSDEDYPWHHLRKRVRSVVVKEGVTVVGINAFSDMKNLTKVSLPKSLEVIQGYAFHSCTALASVQLPEGLKEIGWSAFAGCTSIKSIQLPASLEQLSSSVFSGTGITTVTVPAKVEWISGNFFDGMAQLKTIQVTKGNTAYKSVGGVLYSADGSTLIRCPQKMSGAFAVPDGVRLIESNAFAECASLTSVVIPDGVTTLGSSAFDGCTALTSLILPKSLTTIGSYCIIDTQLTQLVIPESVMSVEGNAFYRNEKLAEVIFLGDAPAVGDYPLANCAENVIVYYPKTADRWKSTWGDVPTKAFSYKLTSTATCTKSGTETITSSAPKLSYSRQVAPLGHDLTKWTLTKAATETAEGQWKQSCTRCAYAETVAIPSFLPAENHAASSYNNDRQTYYSYHTRLVTSDLTPESDGFTRVEGYDGKVIVEKYDKNLNFVSQRILSCELPSYGGYYTDGSYRFLIFGEFNPLESNDKEVFRIVRYSMDWQRMDSTSIYGANTYIPFDAGCMRMAHYDDYLYIRTAHEMYMYSDGCHHQASVFLLIHIPTMTLVDQVTGMGGNGYVSHSFNQFITIDGTTIVTLDHGDAYPRSAVLIRYPVKAGEPYFHTPDYQWPEEVDTITYYGEAGENYTGASIGALEASGTHYLTAGNSVDQTLSDTSGHARNIYVTATSKTNFTEAGTKIYWITSFAADSQTRVSTPHLVKVDNSRFLLMWTEDENLRYTFLGANGKPTGKVYSSEGALSDCRPVLTGNKIIWYVTNNYEPEFYTIDLNNPGTVTKKTMDHIHTFGQWDCWWEPTATEEGTEVRTCSCGESETRSVPSYSQLGNPFEDISEGKYYYGPVLWAYYKDITTGKTATTFLPNNPCTRSQIVTFLWRAMGCPEPETTENPFEDVPEGKFYYKAVLWALENGITTGKTATTFQPDAPCTRAQVVTFLWRTMNEPKPWNPHNPFWDVPENKYYTTAVLWALENGITTGKTENTFLPDDTCTRAQIVTFLYRTLVHP